MTRTLYEVRPPVSKKLDVLASHERLFSAIEKAQELWRLLGNEECAVAIDDVIAEGHGHDIPALHTTELKKLLELVSGLDAEVVGPLTDAEHKLSPEKVVELRGKTEVLDLDERRGSDAQWAVAEALISISGMQNVLRRAIEDGTYLVVD